MAAAYELTDPPSSSAPPTKSPVTSRRPLPLSATQEAQVRTLYYTRVRGYCAQEIKEFAACATNKTITATWKCKKERGIMNSCMLARATPEEFDRSREEWFRLRIEKRKAKELAIKDGKVPPA